MPIPEHLPMVGIGDLPKRLPLCFCCASFPSARLNHVTSTKDLFYSTRVAAFFFFRSVLWLLAVATVDAVAATSPGVMVDVTPARVVRRTFDPARPPPDMPKLIPPEVGQCVYEFGCEMETRIERPARSSGPIRARVTGTAITLRLNITLWTPIDGPHAIIEHEEGHREICERYYRPARAIAEHVGRRMVGQTLAVSRRDPAATDAALRRLQDAFIKEILRETLTRCSYAQTRFDAITEHSRAAVPVADAISQAVAEERAFHRSGANYPAADHVRSSSAPSPATDVPPRYPPTRPPKIR